MKQNGSNLKQIFNMVCRSSAASMASSPIFVGVSRMLLRAHASREASPSPEAPSLPPGSAPDIPSYYSRSNVIGDKSFTVCSPRGPPKAHGRYRRRRPACRDIDPLIRSRESPNSGLNLSRILSTLDSAYQERLVFAQLTFDCLKP